MRGEIKNPPLENIYETLLDEIEGNWGKRESLKIFF